MCAPGVTAVLARSGALAPPYGVPAALGRREAGLRRVDRQRAAVGVEREVVLEAADRRTADETQVEESSSAMNASLNCESTKSGYSSDRKRKSKDRQLAPAGHVDRDREHGDVARRVAAAGRGRLARRHPRWRRPRLVGLVGERGVAGREHGVGRAVGWERSDRAVADAGGIAAGRDRPGTTRPRWTVPAAGMAAATAFASRLGVTAAPDDAAMTRGRTRPALRRSLT